MISRVPQDVLFLFLEAAAKVSFEALASLAASSKALYETFKSSEKVLLRTCLKSLISDPDTYAAALLAASLECRDKPEEVQEVVKDQLDGGGRRLHVPEGDSEGVLRLPKKTDSDVEPGSEIGEPQFENSCKVLRQALYDYPEILLLARHLLFFRRLEAFGIENISHAPSLAAFQARVYRYAAYGSGRDTAINLNHFRSKHYKDECFTAVIRIIGYALDHQSCTVMDRMENQERWPFGPIGKRLFEAGAWKETKWLLGAEEDRVSALEAYLQRLSEESLSLEDRSEGEDALLAERYNWDCGEGVRRFRMWMEEKKVLDAWDGVWFKSY